MKKGDIYSSNNYGDFEVVEYINNRKVKIRFLNTGYEMYGEKHQLIKGHVKDPYHPLIYNIGYVGVGVFKTHHKGKHIKEYSLWKNMLRRCYNDKANNYHRYGGRGVSVCKEWHNFQVFALWRSKQSNFNKNGFQLDKDLTVMGSKIYSPDTCSFVPRRVNNLSIASNKTRGKYPVGVYYYKPRKKYYAQCSNGTGTQKNLGYHDTPDQAFEAYRTYKEALIRKVAKEELLSGNITKVVYNNLLLYKIDKYPD